MKQVLNLIVNKGKTFSIILILQTASLVFSLYIPLLYSMFLDLLSYTEKKEDILYYCIYICIITLVSIITNFCYNIISLSLKNRFSFDLNLLLINTLKKVHLELFNSFNPSYLNQRIKNDSDEFSIFLVDNLFNPFLNLVSSIYILQQLLKINILFGVIFIVSCVLFVGIYSVCQNVIYKVRLELTEKSNYFFDYLNQLFFNEKKIREASIYNYVSSKIKNQFFYLYAIIAKFNKLDSLFTSIDDFIDLILTLTVFSIGGIAVLNHEITIGEFTIISSYFKILVSNSKYFIELFQESQSFKVAYIRIHDLLSLPLENNGHDKLAYISFIELVGINYTFQDVDVFKKGINLKFYSNEYYIITGKNGVGKSTLLSIINGTLNSGRKGIIKFNNKPIEYLDMYHCRFTNISTCTPITSSLTISVREYIDLYSNFQDVIEFLNHFYSNNLFNPEIFNLFNLLEYKISELSLGQKQLLSLLTCLSKRADIYLLDEPTSNLNLDVSSNLLPFIQTFVKNKIIIIVTHDKILLDNTSNIIIIE